MADSFFILFEDSEILYLEDANGSLLAEDFAETAAPSLQSGYEICDRSGFRARPGELVRDEYNGIWVLPKYKDKYYARNRIPKRRPTINGPYRPERKEPVFISVSVSPEDL